jgi:hypothetical protein
MQWIYGGAWIVGSNEDNNMQYISDTNKVVIVAANYRLDVFGWIALQELEDEDENSSYGNYGLHDQGFALEWTQRNIHLFGGDKNKVTIFGESAGGFSVCQHLVRPASNGTFSHAIMESGDCDGPWLIVEGAQAKTWGKAYAKDVGCEGKGIAKCMRDMPLRKVCTVCGMYCMWYVLYVVCTVCGMYCMGYVLYGVCTVCGMYCMGYVLYVVCTVWGMYCMGYVLYVVCTVWGMYCMGYVLYGVCTVWGMYCMWYVLYVVCTVWGMYCT